jgi:pyruvate formate lyase activating enzyme
MNNQPALHETQLQAHNPFELRVNLGQRVPESEVRKALATGELGFLHSFTTGSAVDGPGIRVVAWTSGCHFRCLYCHNPDTWNINNGIPVSLERAIEELRKYRHGLKAMSGGFTLSGGEPLMQDRFAARLLGAAHDLGIHTALDTNGSLGHRLNDAELKTIDLMLLDIKSWDPERHRLLTKAEVGPVLQFASRLAALSRPMWLRFVLVPGLTDNHEDIEQIAAFAADLGNVDRVDVLPFHQMGRFKWRELNLNYTLSEVRPPTPEAVEQVRAQFRAVGLSAF